MEFLAACVIMSATMYHEPQPLSCGGRFKPEGWSVANKDKIAYPCGTQAFVSYKGRTIPVTVNDSGPYTKNELDLSKGAADALKFPGTGKICFQLILPEEGKTTDGRKLNGEKAKARSAYKKVGNH